MLKRALKWIWLPTLLTVLAIFGFLYELPIEVMVPSLVVLFVAGLVATMEPGSVIVDVAVDQGGCIETVRPTTHDHPTFVEHGVVHYGVTNMPGAVAQTSTFALTNTTIGYAVLLADAGAEAAIRQERALALGVNVYKGYVTCEPVAGSLSLPCRELLDLVT